jgi:hypothetical protein
MGMERVMASSKLSVENAEFLDEWERRLKPYKTSESSLVDLAVRIVRHLVARGELNLDPKALQELLGNESRPGAKGRQTP